MAGLCDSNIIIRNKEYRELFNSDLNHYSIEANVFGLTACLSAYTKGDKWAEEQNEYIYENYNIVKDYFNHNIPKATIYKLEGTYLTWINLSFLGLKQEELMDDLMKAGVLVGNGIVYDKDYVGYIRLNLACGRKQLLDALASIKKVCDR